MSTTAMMRLSEPRGSRLAEEEPQQDSSVLAAVFRFQAVDDLLGLQFLATRKGAHSGLTHRLIPSGQGSLADDLLARIAGFAPETPRWRQDKTPSEAARDEHGHGAGAKKR